MDTTSPMSLYSAVSVERRRRTAVRRKSGRRRRPVIHRTPSNQAAPSTGKETTRTRTAQWSSHFDHLLSDCAGLAVFSAFLREEWSDENVIFWRKCEEYRKSTDASYRKQLARLIYVDHVAESSTDQVNIDADVRQTVERHLSTAPVDLFDAAQRQIYLLMKYDPYPRFLRSKFYWDAVNAEQQSDSRLETVPATCTDVNAAGGGGGGMLSRLRQRWKGVKASTKDDSGHGTSLSSLGSDAGDSEEQSARVEATPVAVTPAALFGRLLRRLSAAKSSRSRPVERSSTPGSVPAARRGLFFDRWRRSTDDEDDARSVTTVVSTRSAVQSPGRRPRRSRSPDSCRRVSVPQSHVVRCGADERRLFAAVMARLEASGAGVERTSTAAASDVDTSRLWADRERLDVGATARQRSDGNRVHRGRRRHRRNTGTESLESVKVTVYFV